MEKKFLMFITLICVLAISFSLYGENSFIIIVNSSNTTSSLNKSELSRIFLKKTSKWSDGVKISPVDLPENSNVRKDFSKFIHGRDINSIKNYWIKMIFSGKNTAPEIKDTDIDVINFVKNKVGAIGYVSIKTAVEGLKILTIKD